MKDLLSQLVYEPQKYQQAKNNPVISDRIYSFCLLTYCSSMRVTFIGKEYFDIKLKAMRTIEECLEITCTAFLDIKHLQTPNLDKYNKWLNENGLNSWDDKLKYITNSDDQDKIMESSWINILPSQEQPRKNGRIIEDISY